MEFLADVHEILWVGQICYLVVSAFYAILRDEKDDP